MDLARQGCKTPIVGTASYKLDIDASGNIVTYGGGQTAAGSKRISINNIAATATKSSIDGVATVFFAVLPGEGAGTGEDTGETTMTVKWESE